MLHKPRRIKARTTIGVAEEMCRYDNSTIISKTNPSDIRRIPQKDIDLFQQWDFVIEGHKVTAARWRSFCVKIEYV